MTMDAEDQRFIDQAAALLERPSFAIRASNQLGRPIAYVVGKIPARAHQLVNRAVDRALMQALRAAVSTIYEDAAVTPAQAQARKWAHTVAAMGLGAGSGLAGGWALALELPITTTLMMRSIASMAQAAGFDPRDPQTALEILTVFAYGSPMTDADAMSDTSFYAQRTVFDRLIREGAMFLAGKSAGQVFSALERGSATRLIELIAKIASRMNLLVGEKFIAQSLPVIGAAGGAAINGLFNDYYSDIAYYAFGLKRLERQLGAEAVRVAYEDAVARLRLKQA